MRTPLVQPKLTVNPPGDRYEQEADEMANRVMRMPEPESQRPEDEDQSLQRQPLMSQITPVVQRQENPEEETAQTLQRQDEEAETAQTLQRNEDAEEEAAQTLQRNEEPEKETAQTLQRQEEPEETAQAKAVPGQAPKISPSVESRIQSQRGGGQPLPDSTRAFFEPRFGADFSGVRVHTNAEANSLSSEINARAFTVGKDIFVGSGQYNPDSSDGRQLLAHELTHTVQQGASLQRKPNISSISTHTVQRGVWSRVKEKAVRKFKQGLNWLVERTIPGYTLLNVFLGKNLITGDAVARSGVNLIKGYMRLNPVSGSILLSELEETKSLPEAGKWVEERVAKLGIYFNDIARRLKLTWEEISIPKGIEGNVKVFIKHLGPVFDKILALSSMVMEKVKELRFEAALRLVRATELLEALKQDPKAFKKAVDDPKAVLKQFMVGALKQGFTRFKDNFIGHFKNALLGWLFGKAAEMGVEMPKKFDVTGLFSLVAQLVGATYQKIRARVVKRLGPKGEMLVSKLEQTVAFVKDLVTKGPIALWELVKTSLSNFKEMIVSQIASLVSMEIIKTAVAKLLSMLNPVGALVQLALTLYRVIKFFIDQWEMIKSVATGILKAIGMVALNKIDSAAKSVESVLATGIKLIISFLARIFNLGGLVDKVKTLIKKISDWVQKPIGAVIDLIVITGRKLLGSASFLSKKAVGAIKNLFSLFRVQKSFSTNNNETHMVFLEPKGKDQGEVFIQSQKVSLANLMKTKKVELEKLPDGSVKTRKKNALDAVARDSKEINSLIKVLVHLPGTPESKSQRKELRSIREIFGRLAVNLAILGISSTIAQGELPKTIVDIQSSAGKAKKVVADPLTKKEGNEKGSQPYEDPRGWNLIRGIDDYESKYVRLHLLSSRLHGPGKATNLTPGRKVENTYMEVNSEKPVYRLIQQNKVLWYEAEITSYRSKAGLTNFATSIKVRFGLKAKNASGLWVRVSGTEHERVYQVSLPDELV
jgi:hypothetical protein